MNRQYRIEEGGVFLALDVSEKGEVFFLHCQRRTFVEETIVPEQKEWYRLVEIQAAGEDCDDHHACKYTGTLPGRRLVFAGLADEQTFRGRCITITQKDDVTGLRGKEHPAVHRQYGGVLESCTEVENLGQEPVGLTYVSSFCLNGLTKDSALPWDRACAAVCAFQQLVWGISVEPLQPAPAGHEQSVRLFHQAPFLFFHRHLDFGGISAHGLCGGRRGEGRLVFFHRPQRFLALGSGGQQKPDLSATVRPHGGGKPLVSQLKTRGNLPERAGGGLRPRTGALRMRWAG